MFVMKVREQDVELLSKSEMQPPDRGETGFTQEQWATVWCPHNMAHSLPPKQRRFNLIHEAFHRKKILNVVFGRWKCPLRLLRPSMLSSGKKGRTTVGHCHQALDGRAAPRARCAASSGAGRNLTPSFLSLCFMMIRVCLGCLQRLFKTLILLK